MLGGVRKLTQFFFDAGSSQLSFVLGLLFFFILSTAAWYISFYGFYELAAKRRRRITNFTDSRRNENISTKNCQTCPKPPTTHHPPTHPTGWNLFCNCCVFIPSMRVDADFFGFPSAFWALASCLGHCHVNLWQKLASLTKICLLTHYLYKQIDGQQLMGVESVVLVVPLGSMGTVPWGSWVLLTGVLQIHGSGEICVGTAPVDAVISWPLLGEFLS